MLMTMGVLNKPDNKHELIILRQRQFYGIIESMGEILFSNIEGKSYNKHSYLLNLIQTHIRFSKIHCMIVNINTSPLI